MAKFEDSIKELEQIVKILEDGEPNLDVSLKNFEKDSNRLTINSIIIIMLIDLKSRLKESMLELY